MQLKALKIFCDVVHRRSFSRAAEENGISQSGASQVVHQLETELGVKLIDRSKRPFILTPEGETYYAGCRDIVEQYVELERRVRQRHEEAAGRVRVASIPSVGMLYMSRAVEEFMAQYPQADVRVEYRHPERVYQEVLEDEADLGLVSYPKASRNIEVIPWREETMVLACAPGHRFGERAAIGLADLREVRLIHFTAELPIRHEIDKALDAEGIETTVVLEFDNIEHVKRAIEIDEGVSLLPWPTVEREVAAGSLIAVPLAGEPLVRPLGILHRHNKALSAAARRFIDFLCQHTDVPAGAGDASPADDGRRAGVAARAEESTAAR